MIVERSMHPGWLSNSYLVADRPGGSAVLIDSGGPAEPILARIEEDGLTVTHLLCTHHHGDHVANNALYVSRFDCAVLAHAAERERIGPGVRSLADGQEVESGGLSVQALHVPGHTTGQLTFLVNGAHAFTGDTLFRRTVGGTRAPGHATFEELRRSIMERLMGLPGETVVHPGHAGPTTVGEEWERNPFIRAWRGLDPVRESRCAALGRPATLLLRAGDYDGGTKCWVRFDAGREEAVVPGSRVEDV